VLDITAAPRREPLALRRTGGPKAHLLEERLMFERYRRSGGSDAHEALVVRFLPLARQLARRYKRGSEPLDDLEQVACIGLLKAIERFDLDRRMAFTTFAVPTILGELRRHFRDRTWSVRVPRDLKELARRVRDADDELETALAHTPTTAEVAAHLEVSVEAVLDARAAATAYTADSLDRPRFSAEPDGDREHDVHHHEEQGFGAVEAAATIAPLLRELDDREREILRLHFEEDLTHAEIGQRIGCSQMHVSRLMRGAFARLARASVNRATARA
jgi:RNA polymerase sigma-B factor